MLVNEKLPYIYMYMCICYGNKKHSEMFDIFVCTDVDVLCSAD